MNARYYDPATGQFISPDTIVPDATNLFDYNRYMYARGNPLKYRDPSGHYSVDELMQHFGVDSFEALAALFGEGGEYAGNSGWYDILRAAQDGDSITATFADYITSLQGTFTRNRQGQIFINMNGAMVPESGFARLGGYVANGRELGLPSDYGMYHLEGKHGGRWATSVSGTQLMGDIGCNTWDCVALGYDVASLGLSIAATGAWACTTTTGPVCGVPAAKLTELDATLTAGATWYAWTQYASGKSSDADLAVALADAAMGMAPGAGIGTGLLSLGWDLADPLIPDEALWGPKIAR